MGNGLELIRRSQWFVFGDQTGGYERSQRIARATLDCVTPEPLPENHWMYTHPRVRLSPHISWSAPESHFGLVETFVENYGRYIRGEQLTSLVDPDQRY